MKVFQVSFDIILFPDLGFTVPPLPCAAPLGMQSKAIPDSRITASSKWDNNHGPDRARLGTARSGHKTGAWSARSNDAGQWIQLDLNKVTKVTRIATQGRSDANQWVKTYLLEYSTNGVQFSSYGLMNGNKDRNTISAHVIDPPIVARYIRLRPKTWYGHISMRLEVYGCIHGKMHGPQRRGELFFFYTIVSHMFQSSLPSFFYSSVFYNPPNFLGCSVVREMLNKTSNTEYCMPNELCFM